MSDTAVRCGLVPGDEIDRATEQDKLVRAILVSGREPAQDAEVHKRLSPDPADIVAATIQERGKVYGEPHLSHENIGLAWTGLIQQHFGLRLPGPIPAFLVELMMAQFKIQRSARVFHKDNYVDVRAYLNFAEHGQENPGQPFTK